MYFNMNQPQAYLNAINDDYRNCIQNILTKYLPLIKWNKNGGNVIDIGCGPGSVTVDILLPSLPSHYKQLIGVDVSEEMIKYAGERYAKTPIKFMVMDIGAEKLPSELEQKFDHIFSFFCLNWIVDQRHMFTNLNQILKTGGDMLLIFIADEPLVHAYDVLYQSDKWRKHMKNYDEDKSPYLHVVDPENEVRKILDSTEFVTKVSTVLDWQSIYQDRHEMKRLLSSVDHFAQHMNENLRNDFMEDVIEETLEKSNCKNRSGKIVLPYKLLVVVAEKKNNLHKVQMS